MTMLPPPPESAGVPPSAGSLDSDLRLSSGQKTAAGLICGCGALLIVCCGGVGLMTGGILRAAAAKSQRAMVTAEFESGEVADTRGRLDRVAETLMVMPELPDELPEAAPLDAWGKQVRYRRATPKRAVLTSAGPDGDFSTSADNVSVDVVVD